MSNIAGTFDVIIVGGGLVGASAACALSGHGLSVAVIEAVPMKAVAQPSYDDRTLALSYTSCQIFEAIGLWPGVRAGVTPIHAVHVSNLGHFGAVRITAAELGIPVLGHVVEGRLIGAAVRARIPECPDVTMICPATLSGMVVNEGGVQVTAGVDGQDRHYRARLVISAEGTQSVVRKTLGMTARERDYGQVAVIANVTPSQAHEHRAFERFTATGPLAVLPHTGRRCGVVWCVRDNQAEALMALDDAAFLAGLQERFGYRLGRFINVGRRACYPLRLLHASHAIGPRCAVIGNAAHTVHPIAAQGFNLGLRDAATLVEIVVAAHAAGRDIGAADLLHEYQGRRQPDQERVVAFTDFLVHAFAQQFAPLTVLRSLGLAAVEVVPGLKRALVRRAMGLADSPARLAQGSP